MEVRKGRRPDLHQRRNTRYQAGGRGREWDYSHPPAQIRTGPIKASGSYLGYNGSPPICGLPYAAQRLCHPIPALSPESALLVRVPLGPRPSLHRLRNRLPSFVRRLLRYYAEVRLLQLVHRRLRLLTFPPRTVRPKGRMADLEISRFPRKERPYMPGSPTTPNQASARSCVSACIAFRRVDGVGIRNKVTFAAQWLACTLPYRRFADTLADACARLGADVGCYSFIAVDLHHLLLAGLPAHLPLTWAGLSPAGSRQLRLAHRYAHLKTNPLRAEADGIAASIAEAQKREPGNPAANEVDPR